MSSKQMNSFKIHIKGNHGKILGWMIGIPVGLIILAFLLSPLFIIIDRPPPREAICRSNLLSFGVALQVYAMDNDGYFPAIGKKGIENLDILVKENYLEEDYWTHRVFYCPGAPHHSYSENKNQVDWSKVSYFYVEGLTTNDNPNTIIMGDKSFENHDWKGRNVLFVDGHIEWENAPYLPHIRDLERKIKNYKISMIVVGIVCLFAGYFLRGKRQKKLNP